MIAVAWLVGCSLLAQPAAVNGILPAGDVRIEATPDHLDLGGTQSALLTLRVFNSDGSPQDQNPPTLLTSAGRIEGLRRTAPGVFTARLVPPASGSPHVAIVLARTRTRAGLIAGWARVPLWGRGKVRVVTKPESQVWLRIGESAFGPVESDAQGRASIAIRVPPGPRQGIAETLDRAGNTSKKTIDLGVKPFNRMAAFALDESVVADGSEQSGLIAFAVDERGDPLIDAELRARARRGRIGQVLPLAPGVYRIAYRAPAELGDGRDRITVELERVAASRQVLEVALTPGLPQRIELAIEPAQHRAGSAQRPAVTLVAYDAAGNVAPASLVDVTTEGGVLGSPVALAGGRVRIPVELSDRFDGRRELVVRAEAVRGQAAAEVRMPLLAARCDRLSLAGPAQLIGDERRAGYTLRCSDRFGNPATIADAEIRGEGLIVEAPAAGADDTLRFTVRTPWLSSPADAELQARVGEARTRLRVHLLPGSGVQAMFGPRLVLGWAYGARWLAGAALDWSLALPLGRDNLLLGVSLGTLQAPPDEVPRDGALHARRVATAPLLAQALYEKTVHPRLLLHGGLAAGPVLAAPALERRGASVNAELEAALLVEAIAGVGTTLGGGLLSLDLRGGYAVPLVDDPPLGALSGLSLGLGYRVTF